MKKIELLAPAGDLEKLKYAFLYGADAVYVGGPAFGLRANANNFTLEELKEGVEFAHSLKKKVYVTVNIALHNKEAKELLKYLKELDKIKVDAIIVSDLSILETAKKHTNLEVHISTQQSTMNKEAAEYLKKEGATRVVLARETSKEDIKDIKENVPIEVEMFIHGAMCASISGRCVLSNVFTNRDANRGGCAQICRWDFDLKDEEDNLLKGEKPFTFCTKDLSLLKHLKEIIDMNVDSLKIEGRMRSIYYIATVVSTYRRAIDNIYKDKNYTYDENDEQILMNCANRESKVQFFDGNYDESCQYYNGRVELSNQDFLGVVKESFSDGSFILEERNYFEKGDEAEIFTPNGEIYSFKIDEIYDEEGNLIDVVRHPKQLVKLKFQRQIPAYSMMRKKILTSK